MELSPGYAVSLLDGGPGKRVGLVDLAGTDQGGPTRIPVAVVRGERPGPTVWITASVHGDEYLGPAAAAFLLARLRPEAVIGRIVLTPVFNPGAARAMAREDPAAPVDMNRIWTPPRADRPEPRTVAWARRELLTRSDLVLDLHSGGNRFLQAPFAVYSQVGGATDMKSCALAKAAGLPRIWAHRRGMLDGALITAAAQLGKPGVLIEMAGEGKSERAWIEAMVASVEGVLAYAGVRDGKARFRARYRVFDDLTIVRNREEGLWSRSVDPADAVASGEALGHVLDPFGTQVEVVPSPVDGTVVGICTYGYVPRGDYVAELAHGFHSEGPPT